MRGPAHSFPLLARLFAAHAALLVVACCLSGCGQRREKALRPAPGAPAPPPATPHGAPAENASTSEPAATTPAATPGPAATTTVTTTAATTAGAAGNGTAPTEAPPASNATPAENSSEANGTAGASNSSDAKNTTANGTAAGNATPATPSKPRPRREPGAPYKLDWEARGASFFEGFRFLWEDHNHGAAAFAGSPGEAAEMGVAKAFDTHAILRAGMRSKKYAFKRESVKIETKKTWKYFLAAMRFSHVPYGCGVWPAFFTLAPDVPWPEGGELDILEYVNGERSMTSFHTSKHCILNATEVNKYGPMPDQNLKSNNYSDYNCLTEYCDTCTSLGCAPNAQPLRTAEEWARSPGVVAVERTESFIKVFSLPDWGWTTNLPPDLNADAPRPDTWDKYLIAYYPFGDSAGCPDAEDIMAPQAFVFSIAFCGDWASKVWAQSCASTGPRYNATATEEKWPIAPGADNKLQQCRAVDPLAEYAPKEDCCTQFIADEDGAFGTDQYLRERAFFNISWFKVYT